jgi:hypothetical protein
MRGEPQTQAGNDLADLLPTSAGVAEGLEADADELLLLAKKIPEPIRLRVLERPDAFRKLVALDDETLDLVLAEVDYLGGEDRGPRKPRSR